MATRYDVATLVLELGEGTTFHTLRKALMEEHGLKHKEAGLLMADAWTRGFVQVRADGTLEVPEDRR